MEQSKPQITVLVVSTIALRAALTLLVASAIFFLWAASDDLHAVRKSAVDSSYNLGVTSYNLAGVSSALADKKTGLPVLMQDLSGRHGVKQVLYNVDALTAQLTRTSTASLGLVRDQQAAMKLENEQILLAVKDAKDLIAHIDQQVNGKEGTLPALTAILVKTGEALDTLTGKDGPIQAGTAALTKTSDSLNALVANKDIPLVLKNLASASGHVDDAMVNINKAADNTQQALGFVRDELSPKHLTFWQTVENAVVSEIPGGLVQLFLHYHPQNVSVVGKATTQSKPAAQSKSATK